MERLVMNLNTGECETVALTPEEIAALPAPKAAVITVNSAQMKEAMSEIPYQGTNLLDFVNSVVSVAPSRRLQIWWAEATEFRSDNEMVLSMCAGLGISEAQRLAVFQLASTK